MAGDNAPRDPGTDPKDADPGAGTGGTGDKGAGTGDDDPDDEPDDDADGDKPEEDLATVKAKLDRADRQAKRRDNVIRDLQAKIKKLEGDKDGDKAPDPVAQANTRLVRAEARSVLAGAGITDRKDQGTVLGYLSLAGVEVSPDGDVNADAIQDIVDDLSRIFGGTKGTGAGDKKRTFRVDTRDKGSKVPPADPDSERYARFLRGQRG